MCPTEVFDMIVKQTNQMVRESNRTPIKTVECLQYLAMRLQFLSVHLNHLDNYFAKSDPHNLKRDWWLSHRRFTFLNHNLHGSIDNVAKKLSISFSKSLLNSQIGAIDESIFKYQGLSPCI